MLDHQVGKVVVGDQLTCKRWPCVRCGRGSKNLDEEDGVRLGEDVTFTPDLYYFLQCKIEVNGEGAMLAQPVIGNGSGDFANLVDADGFIVLPQGKSEFSKGDIFSFIPYRN